MKKNNISIKEGPAKKGSFQIKQEEPICAIATPLGEGGISVIRVSGAGVFPLVGSIFKGKKGIRLLEKVKSHRILYGWIYSLEGQKIDEVLLSIMRSPGSYTREDVVEIHCHGGAVACRRILEILFSLGIRLADPGEFTKRAFLNGRIDLAQAEAVMELIRAKSELGFEAALNQLEGDLSKEINDIKRRLIQVLARIEVSIDFCEEDIVFIDFPSLLKEIDSIINDLERLMDSARGGIILREGIKTVIAGRTNVGKSSLFNRLLRADRAIVTPLPGTTRDLLEETAMIGGVLLRIIDTAGLRSSRDPVEKEGIKRSQASIDRADLVIVVLDGSEELTQEDQQIIEHTRGRQRILIVNKIDKGIKIDHSVFSNETIVELSAESGEGMKGLHEAVKENFLSGFSLKSDNPLVTTLRQREALRKAHKSLFQLKETLSADMSWEFLALDLREALDFLGEITGSTVTDDILKEIFSDFCIGK